MQNTPEHMTVRNKENIKDHIGLSSAVYMTIDGWYSAHNVQV